MPAEQALEFLAHTLTNRLLHAPTMALRDAALRGDAELSRAVERMFRDALPGTRQADDSDAADDRSS